MEQRLDDTYLRHGPVERAAATAFVAAGLGVGIFLAAWGISFLWRYAPPEIAVHIENPEVHVVQGGPLVVTQAKPFDLVPPDPVKIEPGQVTVKVEPPPSLPAGNRDYVRKHPVATKRVLRAFIKATDLCVTQPERVAQRIVDAGFTPRYDYALQTLKEISYAKWREYDPEDTIRFYSLRLREAGLIKATPNKILAEGTDWRFFNELKRELRA